VERERSRARRAGIVERERSRERRAPSPLRRKVVERERSREGRAGGYATEAPEAVDAAVSSSPLREASREFLDSLLGNLGGRAGHCSEHKGDERGRVGDVGTKVETRGQEMELERSRGREKEIELSRKKRLEDKLWDRKIGMERERGRERTDRDRTDRELKDKQPCDAALAAELQESKRRAEALQALLDAERRRAIEAETKLKEHEKLLKTGVQASSPRRDSEVNAR
jgi:hypothetical protein